MNWQGFVALIYGIMFFAGAGNLIFRRRLGPKRLGRAQITSESNPVKFWGAVISFFVASLVCFYWFYTHSIYGTH